MAHLSKYIQDRKFEDRGFLEFFYEKEERRDTNFKGITVNTVGNITTIRRVYENFVDNYTRVKVPFFENPSITESKTSRLGKYQVIGRNSDLYSYQGSNSRSINLTFFMTLPHLYEFSQLNLTSYKPRAGIFSKLERDPKEEKLKFKRMADLFPPSKTFDSDKFKVIVQYIKNYEDTFLASVKPSISFEGLLASLNNFLTNIGLASSADERLEARLAQTKVKALYHFWINVIRTSTLGSNSGALGPPIIKLTFGPMYQRVPFIAQKYDISIDETAGYDSQTLLPRRVRCTLTLEEFRVGNFGEYKPISDGSDGYDVIETSENVTGWNSVLDHATTDPRVVPPGFIQQEPGEILGL